jgi:excisionase family DNA binding protein
MQRHFGCMTRLDSVNRSQADEVFNLIEAADYLHQKPRTVRLWLRSQSLPHYKPTAKVLLFRRSDLDRWLERSRVVLNG